MHDKSTEPNSGDLKLKIGDVGRIYHSRSLQLNRFAAKRLEQPDAVAENHRRNVKLYLVDQFRRDELLDGTRATDDLDVLVARSRP